MHVSCLFQCERARRGLRAVCVLKCRIIYLSHGLLFGYHSEREILREEEKGILGLRYAGSGPEKKIETDGILERKGEVEASCEQRENESHDTERRKGWEKTVEAKR